MENNQEIKMQRLESFEGTALTENAYNVAIGLTLLWGILINIFMAMFLTPYIIRMDYRLLLIVYIVVSFACIFVIHKSHQPAISFIGFTGLAAAMGLVLTYFLTYFSGKAIYSAFLTTGIIVVSMILLSVFYPGFFLRMGRVLLIALIGSVVIELIGSLLLRLPLQFMNFVVVAIFSGYIGYDWSKAQMYPKTLDNAIDSAADIYVDIINIFIRILSIMGNKKD